MIRIYDWYENHGIAIVMFCSASADTDCGLAGGN